MTYIWYYNNG